MTESQLDALLEYIDARMEQYLLGNTITVREGRKSTTEKALKHLRYEFLNDKALAEGK